MKITIPTSLSEITVEQYQRYNRVLNLDVDEEAKTIGAISIFCNISIDDVMLMPIDEVKEISNILFNTLALEPKFIQRFGKYDFEPNIDDITTAVYLDAEKYILDIENAHRALAVMYREVDKTILGNYTIKPYEGSDKLCNEMLNAPLEVYLGLRLFFWNLSKDLLKATREYLCNPSKEVEQLEATLQKNGGGIQVLIQSLTDLELLLSKPLF
jgi:hypothetical protein